MQEINPVGDKTNNTKTMNKINNQLAKRKTTMRSIVVNGKNKEPKYLNPGPQG